MTKYREDYFKEVAKIVIVFKSYCHILVLPFIMVTIPQSLSVVTSTVAMVNDHWVAIILSIDQNNREITIDIIIVDYVLNN